MASIRTVLLCALLQGQAPEGPPRPPDLQAACQKAAGQFCQAINQRKPDLFRSSFAPNMLEELDRDKMAAYVDDFRDRLGKITLLKETVFSAGTGFFKLTAEKGVTKLEIRLDADGLISGFAHTDWPRPIPVPARNSMPLRLPFREEWYVLWGGQDPTGNCYMILFERDRCAVDFFFLDGNGAKFRGDGLANDDYSAFGKEVLAVAPGSGFWGDGQANGDYFAFGKEVLAVAPGRVVQIVDGLADNLPGFSNPTSISGNTIIIEHANHEFSLYAHLKHQSIAVKVGDAVTAGQLIARCGNSGASREPHLHFCLINSDDSAFATGFPAFFRDVAVRRDGRDEVMKDYEPKRGDLVSPVTSAPGDSRPAK